jgi:hydroxymethylpyrimidine kinase/phosphomethylpyrimidine kinase/thiamine-phosphate diphosphorylase
VNLPDDMSAAAAALIGLGTKAALVKGGHLPREADSQDLLATAGATRRFASPRIETEHTHGTGCYLSSAIAALLARGESLERAVAAAKDALTESLLNPVVIGSGRGYPGAPLVRAQVGSSHADRLKALKGIYYVTDDSQPVETILGSVRSSLASGVRVIQFRDKLRTAEDLIALAKQIRAITRAAGALCIINDRCDVALAADADGVHLGPGDFELSSARTLLGPDRLIGISGSGLAELDAYGDWRRFASYIGCGPVYGTRSKGDAGSAIGCDAVVQMVAIASPLPVIAIGGITANNVGDIASTGASGAAVLSAISRSDDFGLASRALVARWALSKPDPALPTLAVS